MISHNWLTFSYDIVSRSTVIIDLLPDFIRSLDIYSFHNFKAHCSFPSLQITQHSIHQNTAWRWWWGRKKKWTQPFRIDIVMIFVKRPTFTSVSILQVESGNIADILTGWWHGHGKMHAHFAPPFSSNVLAASVRVFPESIISSTRIATCMPVA